MNREEKMRLIMEDEKLRKLEEQSKLMRVQQMINGPSIPGNTVSDDFQTEEVGLDETDKTVYELDIPAQKALVIQYIGNDWYPGVSYDVRFDEEQLFGPVDREMAPTNNPMETTYVVRERVEWKADNLSSDGAVEARNLGVVTGGKYIPVEFYDTYAGIHNEAGFFTQVDNDFITM